jgi:hypothetical protein
MPALLFFALAERNGLELAFPRSEHSCAHASAVTVPGPTHVHSAASCAPLWLSKRASEKPAIVHIFAQSMLCGSVAVTVVTVSPPTTVPVAVPDVPP